MKLIKMFLFFLFFSAFVFLGTRVFAKDSFSVEMNTTPIAQNIVPDVDFVRTTLTVKDQEGKLLKNAYLKLHIYSPKGNKVFSTDFPWVENTPLMVYEGYVNNGVLEFDYIYPIRGNYRIDVQAGLNPKALSEKRSLSLSVRENPMEFRNLLIFIVFLLGFGAMAGFIIGRGNPSKEAAFTLFILMLSFGVILWTPSNVYADHSARQDLANIEAFTEKVTNVGINLDFTMDPGEGKVGMLNELTFTAKDMDNRLIPNTTFDVKLWHEEDNKSVFSAVLFGKSGWVNFNFQFFDGAEYEIRVVARNNLGEGSLTRVVESEGIDPPMSAKVKTTIYFVLITLVGICAGLKLQKNPSLQSV